MKIAVTGGIASGKTTACRFFEECGAKRLSADEIVHEILQVPNPLYDQVCQVLGAKGHLSRSEIADVIFADEEKLAQVEAILHPAVRAEVERRSGDAPLTVVEMPLLFEAGYEGDYDAVVALVGPSRGGEERRAQRQWTPEEKAAKADYLLDNGGTLEELRAAVQSLFQEITNG